MSTVFVLGRDDVGIVAEDRTTTTSGKFLRYYLTECCGASAKGGEDGTVCRACYYPIDPSLGGIPDKDVLWSQEHGIEFKDKSLALIDVYGDGLPYDVWKQSKES